MVEDAIAGKIDLIIIKLVSCFAGNIVDSLTMVRELKKKYDEATASIEQKKSKKVLFKAFIKNLEDLDSAIQEFDEEFWCNLVQKVAVTSKGHIAIVFKNGMKIEP